jgi:hypothetical protein
MVMKVISSTEDGIFIPQSLLPSEGEWIVSIIGREIILRPKRDMVEAHENMRRLSDELYQKYGEFPDSSELIRQDRDER